MPKKNLEKMIMELVEAISNHTVVIVITAAVVVLLFLIFEPYIQDFLINSLETTMQNIK